jgi:hypothetical protein
LGRFGLDKCGTRRRTGDVEVVCEHAGSLRVATAETTAGTERKRVLGLEKMTVLEVVSIVAARRRRSE